MLEMIISSNQRRRSNASFLPWSHFLLSVPDVLQKLSSWALPSSPQRPGWLCYLGLCPGELRAGGEGSNGGADVVSKEKNEEEAEGLM